MNVLIYAKNVGWRGRRLQQLIEAVVRKKQMEVFQTVGCLSKRLRQPLKDQAIAVLLAENKEELREFLSIKKLLGEMRIILILPDRSENTIAKGHRLHPRFLSFIENDFSEVVAVLGKILENAYSGISKKQVNRS